MTTNRISPAPALVAEATPVQLARMEGTLNLVADRVQGLTGRVDRHDLEIGNLKSQTQTLREQAVARDATAVALATALKEADESRRNKDTQTWSPFQKMLAVIAVLAAIASVAVYYLKA